MCLIDFGSIWQQFWVHVGHHLGDWRHSRIHTKSYTFLMNFDGSGGRSWHHFLVFLGCLFQDRFVIVLGWVLVSIWEPFGLPNGVHVEGFGGSGLGTILGWFLGGSGTLLKFKVQQHRGAIRPWRGPR